MDSDTLTLAAPFSPGPARTEQMAVWRVVVLPGVAPVLVMTLAWILSH